MQTKTMFLTFMLLQCALFTQAQQKAMHIKLIQPVQSTPELVFEKSVAGLLISENHTEFVVQPKDRPDATIAVPKTAVNTYTLGYKNYMMVENADGSKQGVEALPVIHLKPKKQKGKRTQVLKGYPLVVDSMGITVLHLNKKDMTRYEIDEIQSIRIPNAGAAKGVAIGSVIGLGGVWHAIDRTERAVEEKNASGWMRGMVYTAVSFCVATVTPIAGFLGGRDSEQSYVRGNHKRYFKAQRRIERKVQAYRE